ncbi:hypothetical protein EDC04DRAFT_2610639 [Pisolithus marmoratus]|nr:hypothetical protein EDC04DRAFT_2610639 [Pisolithus marmoratus]
MQAGDGVDIAAVLTLSWQHRPVLHSLVVLELAMLALRHENNSPNTMSILLSLMNEEVALVYQALGCLEPAGEAKTLRKKLALLLSNEVDSEDALLLPKTVARPSPDALASVHYDSPLQSPALWINSIRNGLVNSHKTFEGNDLESIISWCQALRESDVTGQFLQMLAGIQLSFIYQELVNAEVDLGKPGRPGKCSKHVIPSMTKFYHSHIHPLKNAPALQTFQEWLAAGCVSVLTTSPLWSWPVIGGRQGAQAGAQQHSYYAKVSPNSRACAAGTAISPQPSQSADMHPHPALPDPMPLDVTIIKMCYSHFHTLNTCFPAQCNQQENVTWTNLYCKKAEQGRSVQSALGLHKLELQLQDFYPNGYKASKDAYIHIPMLVHLPEAEYEALAQVAESLPGNAVSAVEPFISLVININIQMEVHQDQFDKNLCLALAIGNFSGGGLVLHKQGLVLELQNGDFAVFHSSETTHFNLNHVGRQATFVMQTDAEFDKSTGASSFLRPSNLPTAPPPPSQPVQTRPGCLEVLSEEEIMIEDSESSSAGTESNQDPPQDIWHFFEKGDRTVCKVCKQAHDADPTSWMKKFSDTCFYIYAFKTGTYVLWGHIEHFHFLEYLTLVEANGWPIWLKSIKDAMALGYSLSKIRGVVESGRSLPSHPSSLRLPQQQIQVRVDTQCLVAFIIANDQLLQQDLKDSQIPHQTKIHEDIVKAWQNYFVALRAELAAACGHISHTTDIWSDHNRCPFLAMTAHWIAEEAGTGLLRLSHTGKSLSKTILYLLDCAKITAKSSLVQLFWQIWCNWTKTSFPNLEIRGNWTKTALDQLPPVA